MFSFLWLFLFNAACSKKTTQDHVPLDKYTFSITKQQTVIENLSHSKPQRSCVDKRFALKIRLALRVSGVYSGLCGPQALEMFSFLISAQIFFFKQPQMKSEPQAACYVQSENLASSLCGEEEHHPLHTCVTEMLKAGSPREQNANQIARTHLSRAPSPFEPGIIRTKPFSL